VVALSNGVKSGKNAGKKSNIVEKNVDVIKGRILKFRNNFFRTLSFKKMLRKENIFLGLFFIATLLNLTAELTYNQTLTYISKPLLMIFLGLHFWTNRTKNRYINLILIGLFFAFLGDVFLLFKNQGDSQTLFFLLGLGSILVTQLCYFLAFTSYAKGKGFVKKQPWILLPFIFFLIGNTYMLWGDLPAAFRLPVFVYSLVIALMAMSCANLYKAIPARSFQLLFIGVLLFMLSDSLIGLNQFKQASVTVPYADFLIMGTYILAQYLIVKGSLLLEGKEK